MPKCTINGKEIEVKEGTTVIEAFKKVEADIAHYCWHPGLSIAGVCRLCMVDIEGNPKLQIACNTVVTEGMRVSNQSEKVKEAVRWGMDFHLINHPLDCPICDQAGECGLQEQYMKYGQYDSSMSQPKVKKHKVVDLGPTVVLDSERCILCSRCVRFTDEVTKTHELGIFNRGDRSEIGTFDGRPLDNHYSLNTVDICPVGALTSKDFRFKQRVWYLKDVTTTCPGCSTGCKIKVYYNKEGLFRVKPEYDPEVNGYWMSDKGRELYKFVNVKTRIQTIMGIKNATALPLKLKDASERVSAIFNDDNKKIAVVLTGQNTNEEYASLKEFLSEYKNRIGVYYWQNNKEGFDDFDGLLRRGDKNPNTAGLKEHFPKMKDLSALSVNDFDEIIVFAPENVSEYPEYETVLQNISAMKKPVIFVGSQKNPVLFGLPENSILIPAKTFFEKNGTFTNFKGMKRQVKLGRILVSEAIDMQDFVKLVEKQFVPAEIVESRKHNEMAGVRGPL